MLGLRDPSKISLASSRFLSLLTKHLGLPFYFIVRPLYLEGGTFKAGTSLFCCFDLQTAFGGWNKNIFCLVGARESTLEDIGILGVVVLPYGMLVNELLAGLLDELFGLRWILFLRRWTPVSVSTVQGHPKTLFCKIPHRRNRSRLDLSITLGRVKISRWPCLSCTIFEVHVINSLRFSKL